MHQGNSTIDEQMSDIRVRIEALKAVAYEVVNGQGSQFSTNKQEIAEEVASISSRNKKVDNSVAIESEVKAAEGSLHAISNIAKFLTTVELVDSSLLAGNIIQAAQHVLVLIECLAELPGGKDGRTRGSAADISVIRLARNQMFRRRILVVRRLVDLWASTVSVTTNGIEISSSPTAPEPTEILHLLAGLEAVDPVLSCLAESLSSDVYLRLLSPPFSQASFYTEAGKSIFSFSQPHECLSTPIPVLKTIVEVSEFIYKNIFSGNFELFSLVSSVVWPLIAEAMNTNLFTNLLPTSMADLFPWKESCEEVADLEIQLAEIGFITNSDKRLSQWASESSARYANIKRQTRLQEAREIILDKNSNLIDVTSEVEFSGNSPVHTYYGADEALRIEHNSGTPSAKKKGKEAQIGDNSSFFHFPLCKISSNTYKLSLHIAEILAEAASSPSFIAASLILAARDCLTLWRAIIQAKTVNESGIDSTSSMALHNDYLYLSHRCLTYGLALRNHIPEEVAPVCTLVDLFPVLRDLGDAKFKDCVDKNREIVISLLQESGGLFATHTDNRFHAVDMAIKQALHHLATLNNHWRPILPPAAYLYAMGSVFDALLASVVKNILGLPSMEAQETRHLDAFLRSIMAAAKSSILSSPVARDSMVESGEFHCVSKSIASWSIAEALALVLSRDMSSITSLYRSNKLYPLDASQVRHLIRAIFADTADRRGCLEKI